MIPPLPPLQSYLRKNGYIEPESSIQVEISSQSETNCIIRVNPNEEQSKKLSITDTTHPTVYRKIQPLSKWVNEFTVPESIDRFRVKFKQTGIQTMFYTKSSEVLHQTFKQLILQAYPISSLHKFRIHTVQDSPISLKLYTGYIESQRKTVPANSAIKSTLYHLLRSQFREFDPQRLTQNITQFHVKSEPNDSYVGFDITTQTDYVNCTSCDLTSFFQNLTSR